MSDPSTYDYGDEPSLLDDYAEDEGTSQREDRVVRIPRSNIRELEKVAKEGRQASKELGDLQRKVALIEAGVDLSSPAGKMFAKGYDGELTAEAIRQAASEVGAVPSDEESEPGEPTEQETSAEEEGAAELERQRQELSSAGTSNDEAPPVDPYKAATDIYDQEMESGGQELHALGAAINKIVNEAHQGNQRVILPGRTVQTIER